MINSAHLGLTYKCNMKCKHCFVDVKKDNIKFKNNYKEIIDFLCDKGLFFLNYTYGEALLSDYFFEVASYAKTKNIYQILMSNGFYINDESIVQKLIDNGINQVFISLDSSIEEVHDENRRTKFAWKNAMQALDLLADREIKIGIAFTVRDSNIQEMDSILNIAISKNVDTISFLRERHSKKLAFFQNEKVYFENVRKLIKFDSENKINIKFHDYTIIPIINDLYFKNEINESTYEKYIDMNKCNIATTISIAPNGDAFNCNFIKNKIGNVFESNLEDLINQHKHAVKSC